MGFRKKIRTSRKKRRREVTERGLTYVEMLVFIGMGSVMVATLGVIVSGAFRTSRQQMEQGAITEKARVQLERMSDEIRNAQYVDCNLDADTADQNEHWLYEAEDFEIVVLSNVDEDVEAERVRYFVDTIQASENKKLKRGVMQAGGSLCGWGGVENVRTVMDGLRNVDPDPDVPLFQYYSSGREESMIATPVQRPSSVLRVRLQLYIDEEVDADPAVAEVVTDVVPRGVKDPGACVVETVDYYRYNWAEDFAGNTFNACQGHCLGSAVLGPGQCCPWSASFLWQGDYVYSSCECADTYLPPDITGETVNPGEYSSFVRDCLNGMRCAGVGGGEAICEPGCMDGQPGQCVCVCPAGMPPTLACDDGVDNDVDGTADCADVDCTGVGGLLPDPGCTNALDTSELGTYQCDDGQDNDGDSRTDYRVNGSGDLDCTGPQDDNESCIPTEIPGTPQCNDGIDNDCLADGIDYAGGAGDLQCQNVSDNNEWSTIHQCNDGSDNDGDSGIDFGGPNRDYDCDNAGDESEFPEPSSGPTPTGEPSPPPPP